MLQDWSSWPLWLSLQYKQAIAFRFEKHTALARMLSNNAGHRNDQSDRARRPAVVAAAQSHRPTPVHCNSGGVAQPVHIHSHIWALRMDVVHIHTRTWALRMGLVHIRTWVPHMGLVHIHSHRRALRMLLFHIHGHSPAPRTRLLHSLALAERRRPARLREQRRRRRAPHKRTAHQRSQSASMTMLPLLQQERVVGSSC
jgi:hypothetical protein